jgi:AraC family transcriptional regulator, regulatory protein of adaptative response / methylated-DNA-[protein]-cysteine methyltransferase
MNALSKFKEKTMFTSTSTAELADAGATDVLIPLIRAAATIGFAIAPCSLGFVIIAVSEQLIRSIMVGEDPELLVSDLQNQFPHHPIEINENDATGLVAKVVGLIERPEQALQGSVDSRDTDIRTRVCSALQKASFGRMCRGYQRAEANLREPAAAA